jgi:hypothetical protein
MAREDTMDVLVSILLENIDQYGRILFYLQKLSQSTSENYWKLCCCFFAFEPAH